MKKKCIFCNLILLEQTLKKSLKDFKGQECSCGHYHVITDSSTKIVYYYFRYKGQLLIGESNFDRAMREEYTKNDNIIINKFLPLDSNFEEKDIIQIIEKVKTWSKYQ